MPEISADPPDVSCFLLHSGSGIEENQSVDPDRFSPRAPARGRDGQARDPRGHFAKGHSGNPKGRPRGIPNPKRRAIGLRAWRENREAASAVAERRPWLLRPLLVLALPPLAAEDPAERLGISVEALSDAADMQRALQTVCNAVSSGEIGPHEAGHIARRIRARLRALRRLARSMRRLARLARKTDPVHSPLG